MASASHLRKGALPSEATFPKFLELPRELQDMIWEAALCDSSADNATPGIQFFDIFHSQDPKSSKNRAAPIWTVACNESLHYLPRARSIWASIPSLELNDSAYLINAILWRVSRGARGALGRYGRLKVRADRGTRMAVNSTFDEDPETPHRHPTADIWYEWDQSRDLICLRTNKLGMDTIPMIFYSLAAMSPAIVNPPLQLRPNNPHMSSLAVEYNPAWSWFNTTIGPPDGFPARLWSQPPTQNIFVICMWLRKLNHLTNIGSYKDAFYFIDYRIKPLSGVTVSDLGKPAFEGHSGRYYLADGMGCGFGLPAVEDVVAPMNWETWGEEATYLDGWLLGEPGMRYRDLYRPIHWMTKCALGRFDAPLKIRILACVKPEDEAWCPLRSPEMEE